MFFGQRVIGLDIGSQFIKGTEIFLKNKKIEISNFYMVELPSQKEETTVDVIVDKINELLREGKFQSRNVVLGLGGRFVFMKKLLLPRLSYDVITQHIEWELEQFLPFDASGGSIDWHVLNTGIKSQESLETLSVMASDEGLYKTVEIIDKAKLKCNILDVNGLALANTFFSNYGSTDNEYVCLLNVGSNYTSVVIVYCDDVVFCRDVGVGGESYTEGLKSALDVTEDEAEVLKRSNDDVPETVVVAMHGSHDKLTQEINNVLDVFYEEAPRDVKIKQGFVTGGGSLTKGIVDAFASSFSFPCEKLNPLNNISLAKKLDGNVKLKEIIQDFSAVSIGLGLRRD